MKARKRAFHPVLPAIVLFFAASVVPAHAIEFGAEGIVDNLEFPWTSTAAGTTFSQAALFWGGKAWFGVPLGEDAVLMLTYERDPILRNLATLGVQFERGITKLSVGPFFGFLNSTSQPFNAGLSTQIRFQWPGVAFASVRSDGAIAIGVLAGTLGGEPQTRAELQAGLYAKNSILSATIGSSTFSTSDGGGHAVIDSQDRYLVQVDLYKKNVPYTLLAKAGWETRSKYFEATGKRDVVGSVLIGTTATVLPFPGLTFKLSIEGSVFSVGMENLLGKSPAANDFLFRASFGIYVDTDEWPKPKKAAVKP